MEYTFTVTVKGVSCGSQTAKEFVQAVLEVGSEMYPEELWPNIISQWADKIEFEVQGS